MPGLSTQYPYIYFCRMIKKTLFNVLTLKTYEDSANPGRTVLDSKQFIYTLQPILPVWSSRCTSTVMYSMFYSYTVHPRHFLIFVWSRDTYCYINTVIDKLFKFIILKFSSLKNNNVLCIPAKIVKSWLPEVKIIYSTCQYVE